MPTIIVENDISKWDDRHGSIYHFPSRYLKFLQPGTKVIYYKGRMRERKFVNLRLSKDPHYFGIGVIGKITKEKDANNYFAEINGFSMFTKAVPIKLNGQYLEIIPQNLKENYFRNGVRPVDEDTFKRILSLSSLPAFNNLNDQNENEFTSTVVEGGQKKIYTTIYERKKSLRDQALHIHGYACKVCDFNFNDFYGEQGEGYIHVHHLKPLATNEKEVQVNPKTDLTVVCANCHSMIHRKKNVLLSIEDLRRMIKKSSSDS